MKTIRILTALVLTAIAGVVARAHDKSAALDAGQKAFLVQYEKVRSALADDDLAAAKAAAGPLAESLAAVAKEQPKAQAAADGAQKLAASASLAEARGAFKAVSRRAVHLAEGQEGYYLAHCPMVAGGGGDWVQTSTKISNPYFGRGMLTCGSIK
ncbi:MAG: DUF3347 domain-containing protein [Verrucomicrobiota bacterium]